MNHHNFLMKLYLDACGDIVKRNLRFISHGECLGGKHTCPSLHTGHDICRLGGSYKETLRTCLSKALNWRNGDYQEIMIKFIASARQDYSCTFDGCDPSRCYGVLDMMDLVDFHNSGGVRRDKKYREELIEILNEQEKKRMYAQTVLIDDLNLSDRHDDPDNLNPNEKLIEILDREEREKKRVYTQTALMDNLNLNNTLHDDTDNLYYIADN